MMSADGTLISPHAIIDDRAVIGTGCSISAFATVGPGATLGNGVRVGPGARIADGTIVENGAEIGANAVVGFGSGVITLGLESVVRPGSVVAAPVPPRAIVEGNPAQIVGYVETGRRAARTTVVKAVRSEDPERLPVGGCALYRLPVFSDLRGSLLPIEFDTAVPFAPRRTFIVFDAPGREVRGEHAHRECEQLLIALRGDLSVVIDDGSDSMEVHLDHPAMGLYLPPWVWGIQYKFSADAILLVLASLPYDPDDYIRDYQQFLKESASR